MRKRLPMQDAPFKQHYVALSAALHQVVTVLQDARRPDLLCMYRTCWNGLRSETQSPLINSCCLAEKWHSATSPLTLQRSMKWQLGRSDRLRAAKVLLQRLTEATNCSNKALLQCLTEAASTAYNVQHEDELHHRPVQHGPVQHDYYERIK